MKKLIIVAYALVMALQASAASFQGVKAPDANQVRTIDERVIRFKEMDKEFLVAFGGLNAAFYSFPKTKDNANLIRNFLNDRIKSKKNVKADVNALSREIVSIADAPAAKPTLKK